MDIHKINDRFILDFYEEMKNQTFAALGILDSHSMIHTLGTDSKIIGRIFEMFTQPILEKLAQKYNLYLKVPEKQTLYPDFTLLDTEDSTSKIAIDVKTTYITPNHPIKFTLGSYGSYMRNNTKNIAYPYTDYKKHYVIGFIYKRNDAAQESKIYPYHMRNSIMPPYEDVCYFIQEKYKIAGDKPGSGNKENIGSFPTHNIQDLIEGKGPFADLGQDIFDLYWKYYPKYRATDIPYKSLPEFLRWYSQQKNLTLLHPYDANEVKEKLAAYNQHI